MDDRSRGMEEALLSKASIKLLRGLAKDRADSKYAHGYRQGHDDEQLDQSESLTGASSDRRLGSGGDSVHDCSPWLSDS
jgi:hypothetical protein